MTDCGPHVCDETPRWSGLEARYTNGMWRFVALFALGSALLGCASETAGIEVSFELAPGALAATTPDGRPLSLEAASLALGSVELVACEAGSDVQSTSTGTLSILHVEGSPTLLGVSAILDLKGAAAAVPLGALQPPPGRYCSIRHRYFAADVDAIGLDARHEVGSTLVVRGAVGGSPFVIHAAASLDVVTPLEPALELTLDGAREARFTLGAPDGTQAFAGVTFAADDEREDGQAILANLRGALVATRKP